MAAARRPDVVQTVYGALTGGLFSTLIAVAVLTVFLENGGDTWETVLGALIGLVAAMVLMASGIVVADRVPWLGTSLLFASGFTVLWSVTISLGAPERWVTLSALAVAVALALALGWWRFGKKAADADQGPVSDAGPAVAVVSEGGEPDDAS